MLLLDKSARSIKLDISDYLTGEQLLPGFGADNTEAIRIALLETLTMFAIDDKYPFPALRTVQALKANLSSTKDVLTKDSTQIVQLTLLTYLENKDPKLAGISNSAIDILSRHVPTPLGVTALHSALNDLKLLPDAASDPVLAERTQRLQSAIEGMAMTSLLNRPLVASNVPAVRGRTRSSPVSSLSSARDGVIDQTFPTLFAYEDQAARAAIAMTTIQKLELEVSLAKDQLKQARDSGKGLKAANNRLRLAKRAFLAQEKQAAAQSQLRSSCGLGRPDTANG